MELRNSTRTAIERIGREYVTLSKMKRKYSQILMAPELKPSELVLQGANDSNASLFFVFPIGKSHHLGDFQRGRQGERVYVCVGL